MTQRQAIVLLAIVVSASSCQLLLNVGGDSVPDGDAGVTPKALLHVEPGLRKLAPGQAVRVRVRRDAAPDAIELRVSNLPEHVTSAPLRLEAGALEGEVVLVAEDAVEPAPAPRSVQVSAAAATSAFDLWIVGRPGDLDRRP